MVTSAYGLMVSEDPAPAAAPNPLESPSDDPGPHLSYAAVRARDHAVLAGRLGDQRQIDGRHLPLGRRTSGVRQRLARFQACDDGDLPRRRRGVGEYLTDDTLLARNRAHGGTSAFEVLVPFRTVDGDVFLVDRGWVPPGRG
jgi:hypothetical protein